MNKSLNFSSRILLMAILLTYHQVCAQEWDMTPQPPDASTFSTYGTYPVSYYTGSPNIAVPLFTIDEGEIQVPLNLSYSAGGVKVATESSWVGLGWNLYPGGSITRMVVGSEFDSHDAAKYNALLGHWQSGLEVDYVQKNRPDQNWGTFTGSSLYDIESGGAGSIAEVNVSGGNMGWWSSWSSNANFFQPDIYIFNFLGYSGKFFLNPTNDEIVILDKEDHIEFEQDASNWDPNTDGWIAKLPNGISVYFQDLEKVSQSVFPSDCPVSSPSLTWKITKIVLKSREEINFSYINSTYETSKVTDYDALSYFDNDDISFNSQVQKDPFSLPPVPIYCTEYRRPIPMHYELKTLTQITSPRYRVNFNLVAGETKPRLASIEIEEQFDNSFKIGYDFSTAPFNSPDANWNQYTNAGGGASQSAYGSEANYIKYKLSSLQKYTITGGVKRDLGNPYRFEYTEDIGVPGILSFAQDYWGYYNGEHSNLGLIPDESQMYENQGYYPLSIFPASVAQSIRFKANANRGTSGTHAIQGSIKKIYYPTLGYTEFDFEPHLFYLNNSQDDYLLKANEMSLISGLYQNQYTGSATAQSSGAGVRISKITNYGSDGSFSDAKRFDYNNSGLLLEPVHFWRVDHQAQLIEKINTVFAYAYKVWSAGSSSHSQSFAIPSTVGYSSVTVENLTSTGGAPNGYGNYQFHNYETIYNPEIAKVTVEYLDARNGLPLSVSIYDESSTLLKKTEYTYSKIQNSSFVAMAATHVHADVVDYENLFKIEYTPMISEWWKESQVIETLDGVSTTTNYEYVSPPNVYLNGRLWSSTKTNSNGHIEKMEYFYAGDNPGGATSGSTLTAMLNSNFIAPIKVERLVNNNRVEGNITNYGSDFFPTSSEILEGSTYVPSDEFSYTNGKLTQYLGRDKVAISFLWNYNNTLPIAKAVGATHSTLSTAYTAVSGNLSTLRNQTSLADAQVSGYSYHPLAGLSWQIDPSGIETTYDYDDYGRLEEVTDDDNQVTQAYSYNYKESFYYSTSSSPLDFGDVSTAEPSSKSITFTNYGTGSVSISSITYPTGFSGPGSLTVASGATQQITVTFDPSSAISYSGNISINSTADGPSTISVSGQGVPPTRIISIQPSSLNMGTVGPTEETDQTIEIHNTGNTTFNLSTNYTVSGNNNFTATFSGGLEVGPGQYKQVDITFDGSSGGTGSKSATITFVTNETTTGDPDLYVSGNVQ